jgi:uncharacterized protein YndB with AHSA1/START domain
MNDKVQNAAVGASDRKVVIERTYRATVEELWDLWTTKEGFESWWGPEGFRAEVHAIDPRANGGLHYDMIADTPEMVKAMKQMGRPSSHGTRARFSEIIPCERLVLTHVIDFLPGVKTYESTIVAECFPSGGWVRMVVTLHPMHDEEFTKMTAEGFTSQLTKLDKRFDSKR